MRDQAGSDGPPEGRFGSLQRWSLALIAGLVVLVAGAGWWFGGGPGDDEASDIATDGSESRTDPAAVTVAAASATASSVATSTSTTEVATTPSESSTTSSPPSTTSTTPPEVDDGDPSLVYYNDFSSGVLGPEWERYDSVGNAGWGLRRPSALSIVSESAATAGGRCLLITAAMGTGDNAGLLVSGGTKLLGYAQTHGRYTLRMRVDDDPAQVTSGVALLWPTHSRWPHRRTTSG